MAPCARPFPAPPERSAPSEAPSLPRAALQVVARSREDILAARGVKPTLSPNLSVLATVEALDVKRLLFIGVGCQVGTSALASRLPGLRCCCSYGRAARWAPPLLLPAGCEAGTAAAALISGLSGRGRCLHKLAVRHVLLLFSAGCQAVGAAVKNWLSGRGCCCCKWLSGMRRCSSQRSCLAGAAPRKTRLLGAGGRSQSSNACRISASQRPVVLIVACRCKRCGRSSSTSVWRSCMCWAPIVLTTGRGRWERCCSGAAALLAGGRLNRKSFRLLFIRPPRLPACPARRCDRPSACALTPASTYHLHPQGLEKFLNAASSDPDTVLHYEFMQVGWPPAPSRLQRLPVMVAAHV